MSKDYSTVQGSPSNGPPPYSEINDLPEADVREVEESLRWIPNAPQVDLHRYSPLMRPVAIPQAGIASRFAPPLPYLRAYSPELAAHNVSLKDFTAFIDNLAVAMKAPAPFQALNTANMVAGFVPLHLVQLVSAGVGVASGVGTASYIIARVKKYFASVNQEYFNPRGLKAGTMKDQELLQILGLTGQTIQQVNAVTVDHVVTDMVPLPQRRLRALQPYIAPLHFDVPPPTAQTGVFDRIAAKQQERTIAKQQHKNEKKAEKHIENAEKRARKDNKNHSSHSNDYQRSTSQSTHDDYPSDTSSIASIKEEMVRLDQKAERVNAKADRDGAGASSRDLAKVEKERAKKLEEFSDDRMKLERDLEKKRSKLLRKSRKSKDKYESSAGPYRDERQTDHASGSGYELRANLKDQEKEESQLERLRWIVVQNYQPQARS